MESPAAVSPDIALALAVARLATGERVVFSARGSGLYRSPDDGQSWTRVDVGEIANPSLTTVTVSPDVGLDRTVFAGTTGGILRSTDLGERWQLAPLGSPPPVVTVISCSPSFGNDGVVLAGTLEDGVFRSTDGGASWRPANPGLLDRSVLALAKAPDAAGNEIVIAGTSSGPYLSVTGGRSWQDLPFPDVAAPCAAVAIAPAGSRDGLLLVGTEGDGLFGSPDRGATWARVDGVPPDAEIVSIDVVPGAAGSSLLVTTADGLFRSDDGGTAWRAVDLGLAPHEWIVSALWLEDEGQRLLAGLSTGVTRLLSR